MNKKFLMSGIKKDGTYETPGGVPFMTKSVYKSHIFEAIVSHYRVDEFMCEVYGYARLVGLINDSDGDKIRVYYVIGGIYKAIRCESAYDSNYYYVDGVIDPDGNLLYFGD